MQNNLFFFIPKAKICKMLSTVVTVISIVLTVTSMNAFLTNFEAKAAPPNDFIVPLCRQFSKSLFDLNAQPYLSPTVQVVNATSNAGFFHSAYIPRKVDKPYFRLSGNFMLGFVRNDMKTFNPQIPAKEYKMEDIGQYVTLSIIEPYVTIRDTAGLLNYMLQTMLYQGLYVDKTIKIPEASATTLGGKGGVLILDGEVIKEIIKNPNYPLYTYIQMLPDAQALIDNVIGSLPNAFTLPDGGDLNTVAAGVPQLEIGSLFGTELLLRYVPKVDLGKWVGKFSFWGIGLKHSISQYFYNDNNRNGSAPNRTEIAPFDLSAQIVFQGTSLENTVGVTNAKLKVDANIFNFNLHFSKNFNNIIEVYSGLSYENTKINGSYKYLLPVELQRQIGLMTQNEKGEIVADPENGFPGDTEIQTSEITVSSNHVKWTVGACKNIGPVTLFLDYGISKFNIFSGGIQYRFQF